MPDYSGNACALLSDEDKERLWEAACTLVDARGILVWIASGIAKAVEAAGENAAAFGTRMFGEGWKQTIQGYAEEALWRGYDLATLGMDPAGERQPWSWFNKIVASAVGAAGGFFGPAGMAIDIPISTLLIMRSIAEIARSHGEDIGTDESKRACLEVFAFGGADKEDDDVDVGYWSTRALFAGVSIEVAIRQAATRFGVALSEKMLGQIVPVAGALAGGGLNYAFIDFYQQMSRVHFTIRAMERAYGKDGAVQPCFDQLVRQAKERRQTRKPHSGSDTDGRPKAN